MKKRHGTICAVVMLCFAATTAVAEDDKYLTLDTMTVTAQKQEENVQDVPVAISLFDSMEIEDRMIDTVDDVAKYTPGFKIINYGSALKYAPSIRGLYSDYSTRSSTAGLFIDGVPVTDGTGFDETLLDIERVEVLKGPQGTLYGKNTEVGAINVITKKPTNEMKTRVVAELGEGDKRDVRFTASGALIKGKVYLGISGKHYEKDGFVKNTATGKIVDDREHNYGKIQLRLTPLHNLEASLVSSYIKYDNDAGSSGHTKNKSRKVSNDLDAYNKSDVWMNSLNISHAVNDNLSVTSVTAYRKHNEDLGNDFDFTDDPNQKFHVFADSIYKTLSQELRANYQIGPADLVSGVFLERGEVHIDKDRDAYWGYKKILQDIDSDTIGLFSHLTYAITNRLSVLAGLRYDKVKQEYRDESQSIDNNESELSPKLGLIYHLSDHMMTYVTVAKGYRSGGFNVYAPDGYSKTFDQESLYSYELGIKGLSFNSKLSWDVALYYMDIKDMQVDVYIDPANVIKTNAAEATSMGAELSLKYQATKNLKMFFGFSYNNTEFDKYDDGQKSYSGKKTTFSPEYNYNLGFLYRSKSGHYASADISGYGDMYLDTSNNQKRPAYELVNAKIGYESEHFDIYLYAKNLFDRNYDIDGHYNGVYSYYSQPRELGVSATCRF
jgi:iron complex outermembrane receptor protein